MRNISFALTPRQLVDGTKDVTRRMGWKTLEPGVRLCAVLKGQGLKKGEKVKRLAIIDTVSVRREPVNRMLDDAAYGKDEVRREGFAEHPEVNTPEKWVPYFCAGHGCEPGTEITRIEFKLIGVL